MSDVVGTIKLDSVDLQEHKSLLEAINRFNSNVKIQFDIPIEDIVDMFYYYVKANSEHANDIESYMCITPEIINEDNQLYFTLNFDDDEEDSSDVEFLLKELRNTFGVNFERKCELRELFRVLLMDCPEYSIIEEGTNKKLLFSLYYETYEFSWLKAFLEGRNT